jgi:hypothetical protein
MKRVLIYLLFEYGIWGVLKSLGLPADYVRVSLNPVFSFKHNVRMRWQGLFFFFRLKVYECDPC